MTNTIESGPKKEKATGGGGEVVPKGPKVSATL